MRASVLIVCWQAGGHDCFLNVCGKVLAFSEKEGRTLLGPRGYKYSYSTLKGSIRYWNYLDDYWPCAGGLSAVNTIDTRSRDLMNSGPTRSRLTV